MTNDNLHLVIILACVILTGCSTTLEKADLCLSNGDILKARGYYLDEYNKQRTKASEPYWDNRQKLYEYRFSGQNTVAALVGLIKTYQQTQNNIMYGYYVGILNDFCLRHELDLPEPELKPIEEYLGQKEVNP